MRADACILEPLLEMTANCVYKCEPLAPEESQEDAGPSSKNIRSVQGAGCDLGSNLLFRVTYTASAPYFTILQLPFRHFIQVICQTKFLK
jgi:hypothetical protein